MIILESLNQSSFCAPMLTTHEKASYPPKKNDIGKLNVTTTLNTQNKIMLMLMLIGPWSISKLDSFI